MNDRKTAKQADDKPAAEDFEKLLSGAKAPRLTASHEHLDLPRRPSRNEQVKESSLLHKAQVEESLRPRETQRKLSEKLDQKPTKVLDERTLVLERSSGYEALKHKSRRFRPQSGMSSRKSTHSRLISEDSLLAGVDEDKLMKELGIGERDGDIDSSNRYY